MKKHLELENKKHENLKSSERFSEVSTPEQKKLKKDELKEVSEQVVSFSQSFRDITEQFSKLALGEEVFLVKEVEITATTLSELEKHLASLNIQEKGLENQVGAYTKLSEIAEKNLNDFIPTTSKDISQLKVLIVYASETFSNLKRLKEERKNCIDLYNAQSQKFHEMRLAESGFRTNAEVSEERMKLWSSLYDLKFSIFGLGAIFNAKKIRELKNHVDALSKINSHSDQKYSFSLGFSSEGVSSIAFKKIEKMGDLFSKELEEKGPEQETLFSEVTKGLNKKLIDNTIRKDLAEALALRGRGYSEQLGTKTDREEAIQILEETFDVSMQRSWSDSEPEEDTRKRKELEGRMEGLPYNLRTMIQQRIKKEKANDIWVDFNRGLVRIPEKEWKKERERALLDLQKKIGKTNSSYSSIPYEIGRSISRLYERSDQFTTDVDLERWSVFKSNEIIRHIYGDELLHDYENMLARDILGKMKRCGESSRFEFTYAKNLFALRSVDAAPYLLLNALRVGKDHGKLPFLRSSTQKLEDSTLCLYIQSLSEQDIEKLRAMEIPGLLEVIEAIKNNKDTFDQENFTKTPDGAYIVGPVRSNPAFRQIQNGLEQISNALLLNGDRIDIQYALYTIQVSDSPLGTQADALRELIQKSKKGHLYPEREITVALLARFYRYRSDVEALTILIEHNLLSVPERITVLKHLASSKEVFEQNAKKRSADLEVLKKAFSPDVEAQSKSDEPNERLIAFVAAKNIELDLKPSSSDIAFFFEHLGSLGQGGDDESLVRYSEGVTFTESDAARILKVLSMRVIRPPTLGDNKIFRDFISSFPTGDILTEYNVVSVLAFLEEENFQKNIKKTEKCSDDNWHALLSYYILAEGEMLHLEKENLDKIKMMFSNAHPENRALCLEKLQGEWQEYLKTSGEGLPLRAYMVASVSKRAGGAGDLKHIEGLCTIIAVLEKLRSSEKTAVRTKNEIFQGLEGQEERFARERWSEDDKTAFYNISKSILEAAPSLYTDFLKVFEKMSARELKDFAKEYYPLYQANLVILQNSEGKYNARELVSIRKRLENLCASLEKNTEEKEQTFKHEKKELVDTLQKNIERRLGLLKLPENITDEHIRTMRNGIGYLANIQDSNPTSESVIALSIGLNLNGEWEQFRAGENIDISNYFGGDRLETLKLIIEKRKELFALFDEELGLPTEKLPAFYRMLQEETISSVIGNVQTIDLKLGSVKRSIDDLADPDLYPEKIEKETLVLVKEKGKLVGATLAKTYSETLGKKVAFSEEELVIQQKLKDMYGIREWTPQEVKKLQDAIQTPSLVCGMLRKLEESEVDENIAALQKLLQPSEQVVSIFNTLGEEFKTTSGAMAISQDLAYLENIIVKSGDKLSSDQKKILDEYLGAIRGQMVVLESLYVKAKEYFEKIKKSAHTKTNELLKNRLAEVEKVLYQTQEAVPIVTRATTNLNTIIENMRLCLGCLRKEVNNGTNLTFLDPNKFYLVSQGGKERGSSADEILFFVPVKYASGESEMSFVMDRLYGVKSSDVLIAHVKTVLKKYAALHKNFPEAKLSVLVTDAALASAGLGVNDAQKRITEAFEASLDQTITGPVSVNIPESAFGDHYVEFGNKGARISGERTTAGLRIVLKK